MWSCSATSRSCAARQAAGLKGATIREIHHRVKNHLQTIQSLLRLQTRRLESSEAVAALEQSARRIGVAGARHAVRRGGRRGRLRRRG
ncbi:MAG: histidine kinase dimerization/phosphoacceptor domain -containing protein [Acidimicrobiales bacterium]